MNFYTILAYLIDKLNWLYGCNSFYAYGNVGLIDAWTELPLWRLVFSDIYLLIELVNLIPSIRLQTGIIILWVVYTPRFS